ncbi:hypothetical protein HZQ11_12915 [Elizabethkingia anophelis]|uniref:hypothetical protein n=1 Tax=Elizabethkingia TaxID=308865 RepID=UPI00073986FA|nr:MULTISPECIES: hypothetical protein [Elizabethkingia]KUF43148.1 hypothetical protein AS358_17410 [Elizabethkingia anophelis]MCT3643102.1 hypothetical protein [Elizabethkingia anophelis]MCT3652183.1 hypothetical protein [Elizabethkingia anophelis]MCT3656262.1 hypothetical protein [Elizabethkingia anophelis]MCT3659499.1 hypothetical protein [Elizabethkingia anophelis]
MIYDFYFKKPVFWDYIIALGIMLLLYLAYQKSRLSIPDAQDSYSLTGDLTNITLTLAGFILTILTVLITFKDSSNDVQITDDNVSSFNKFFSTDFYYETVKHLKNCIKSIIFISAIGFFIKLFMLNELRKFFFFYNVLGLTITILTVYRCLLILSKVLVLQKKDK